MLTIYERSRGRKRPSQFSVGLAVAGGGPVGAVYELGALRALEESVEGLRLHKLDTYVGVSAGAFISASLANRIPCVEQCRIFMGVEHAELKFAPQRFLRPAYREYFERLARVPAIARDTLLHLLRSPLQTSSSEIIAELGRALPSGIFDNESIHDFLEDSFTAAGKGNRFDDLDCHLYVVAVDLDTGASVRFGTDENSQVPISKAVQASAALPGLYPPVRIGDRYYVDGALRRTLHASVALDKGVDLLLGINPLVPFAANGSAETPHIAARQLINGGLPLILSQTFRALIQSRMQVGFAKYRNTHPEADLLLLEPDRDDEEIFFTNIFSYASRAALAEHAYQSTREDLRRRADELNVILGHYDMQLDREALADESRTLLESINHSLESHTRVSRSLSRTLDRLEEQIEDALAGRA
jgi:predicted acylesterase/phospholipase RssA